MSQIFILPPRKVANGAVDLNTLDDSYLRLDGANSPMTGPVSMGTQLFRIGNLASNPVSGNPGDIYFNTTAKQVRIYEDGISGWQSIIADTNITLSNAVANQMSFIGGSGVDGGGGNLTFRVTASTSTAHVVSINSLATSFTIVGGISTQRTLTIESNINLNGQSNAITLVSSAILDLNSQTLAITAATSDITLKPSSTTDTIYNIATHANNTWMLSVGGAAFPGAAGSLFYSTSGTFGQLSALALGSSGYVLTAGASAPQWSNLNSISMAWLGPTSWIYNPSDGPSYATYSAKYVLNLLGTPYAAATNALVQFGHGGFTGGGGEFSGSANGTVLGINVPTAWTGNQVDVQKNGASIFTISNGNTVLIGNSTSQLGFFGATPASRVSAYTVTNGSTTRTFNADATSIDELADVLATLIADLKTYGLLQ